MKEQQEIIKKICGILGHQSVSASSPWCFCRNVIKTLEMTKDAEVEYVLRLEILGWLKSKEVLIGCFGEEYNLHESKILDKYGKERTLKYHIQSWQYHYTQLPHTVEECLEYYGRFLG